MNRYSNALYIQEGACNPSGICHSIIEACQEVRNARTQPSDDPAIRLMVHQLAYICHVAEIDSDLDTYGQLTAICKANADCQPKE